MDKRILYLILLALILATPFMCGSVTQWPVWELEGANGIIDLKSTNASIDFEATNTGGKLWDLDVEVSTVWGDDRYLYKENTSPFTPDADYEPATKKYVDDKEYSYSEVIRTDYYCYHGLKAAGDILVYDGLWNTGESSSTNDPDVPRSLLIEVTPGAMQICTGNIEIVGINADGAVISENFDIDVQFPNVQAEETVRAFKIVTNIVITNATGTGTIIVNVEDRIGVSNIPLNATTDIFAMNLNGVHLDPTDYTINATHGTIDMDDVADIVTDDVLEIWCRPFK